MNHIKIIGFDLDQTLYPKSPEIDDAIQAYIVDNIAQKNTCSRDEASRLFKNVYAHKGSGTKALMSLGYSETDGRAIVQTALERADLTPYLRPDPAIRALLSDLKQHYPLALITGSHRDIALQKLQTLDIPFDLFDLIITGETSKFSGEAYKQWLDYFQQKDASLAPCEFLYIGDRKTIDSDIPSQMGITTILVNVTKKDPTVPVPQLEDLHELRGLLC